MGGSALPGALLQNLQQIDARLKKTHLHFVVHRDYELPAEASSSKALVIVISYSGNTEEALSSYRAARKLNLPIFAIASGGTLAQWTKRDRVPCTLIPKGIPPRFAVGYQFGALIGLLVKSRIFHPHLAKETRDLSKTLNGRNALTDTNPLTSLFRSKRIPYIFSSPRLFAPAYSWATNIQENTKLPAATYFFSELDHNLLNAFTPDRAASLSRIGVIALQDEKDSPKTKKRILATARIIEKSGVPTTIVHIKGKTPLQRLMRAYLLGLAFSGMLAEKLNIDPIPVPLIEELKKRLR